MKFEFTPSNHSSSFREYLNHLFKDTPAVKIYLKAIVPAIILITSYVIISIFSKYFNSILTNSIELAIFIIVILLMIFIIRIVYTKLCRSIKNNKLYSDLEGNFTFTIEDGYLIRENQFSTIKIALKNIATIRLLKQGLILSSRNEQIFLFIPNAALPISLKEFIEIFKVANPKLTVENISKKNKHELIKQCILLIVISYLALAASHFIGRYDYEHNFPTYDLIMEDQMEKLIDNSFLYENETLKYSIVFPESWSGKFGIEENADYINVYYLQNGEQNSNTNLLFTIRDEKNSPPLSEYNKITYKFTDQTTYVLWGPKKVYIDDKSNTYSEYVEIYNEIVTLPLKGL